MKIRQIKKNEFFCQISEKYSNIKFHEIPSSGNQVVPRRRTDGRSAGYTDRRDEANSRFSQNFENDNRIYPNNNRYCLKRAKITHFLYEPLCLKNGQ
jgi:hypothetical protein